MRKEWAVCWSCKIYLLTWIFLLILVLVVLKGITLFLIFNETREVGFELNDWVLNMIEPVDVSNYLFVITWIAIFISLPITLRTPRLSMIVFVSIIVIGLARCFMMYLIPLLPPEGIIPLRDEFLEGTFYSNQILQRDLFFSGHTANLALLTFLMDIKWMKYVLGIITVIVAGLLLVQHVHYTIDVVAAPFFAYGSYLIAKKSVEYIVDHSYKPSIDMVLESID